MAETFTIRVEDGGVSGAGGSPRAPGGAGFDNTIRSASQGLDQVARASARYREELEKIPQVTRAKSQEDYRVDAIARRNRELERMRQQAAYENLFGPGEAQPAGKKGASTTDVITQLLGQFGGKGGQGIAGIFQLAGGEGAAAGAAGGGAALAVAGPIGAIAAAAQAMIEEAKRATLDAIHGIGQTATAIAGLDPEGFAQSMEGFAAKTGFAGEVVAATSQELRGFMRALDQTALKLSSYSGTLAAAEAQASVRATMGDIRRAQELGPELARFVEARSETEETINDILSSLLEAILPFINNFLENFEPWLRETYNSFAQFTNSVIDGINSVIDGLEKVANKLPGEDVHIERLKHLRQIERNTRKKYDMLLDDLRKMRPIPQGAQPPNPQQDIGLPFIPAFNF